MEGSLGDRYSTGGSSAFTARKHSSQMKTSTNLTGSVYNTRPGGSVCNADLASLSIGENSRPKSACTDFSASDLKSSGLAGYCRLMRSNLCTRHIQKKLTPRGHHDWPHKTTNQPRAFRGRLSKTSNRRRPLEMLMNASGPFGVQVRCLRREAHPLSALTFRPDRQSGTLPRRTDLSPRRPICKPRADLQTLL